MNVSIELLDACKKDNRKAHYQLYNACYGFLMSICIRYATDKDDANAMLNDGFLKIVVNLDKYKSNIPFGLWVRRIMINTIIDLHRKKKKTKGLIQYRDMNDNTLETESVINNAIQKFNLQQLQMFIANLPNATAKVFNLFAIDGYSHHEIAVMLQISEGTSKWHLSAARQKLQEMILKHAQQFSKTIS